jgi:hypothetical protein
MRPRFVVAAVCGAASALGALVLVACAKGTDNNGVADEGGLLEDDAGRDVNVVPVPRDSSTVGPDGTVLPPDDSGGTCAKKVVINEIKTDGATGNDEMVELYNPSACAVPVGGWEIRYQSGGGVAVVATGHKFAAGDTIAAMGYLVLTPGAGSWTAGMAKTDGQIGLVDDTGTLVDGVGWGTVSGGSYREKTAATAPASGGSIGRSPNGADSDNNKTDFKTYASPSPGAPNP